MKRNKDKGDSLNHRDTADTKKHGNLLNMHEAKSKKISVFPRAFRVFVVRKEVVFKKIN